MVDRDRLSGFGAVIEFFRWDQWAALRAVRVHVPDESGACAGCHTQTRATRWPCLVSDAAHKALSLSERTSDPARP